MSQKKTSQLPVTQQELSDVAKKIILTTQQDLTKMSNKIVSTLIEYLEGQDDKIEQNRRATEAMNEAMQSKFQESHLELLDFRESVIGEIKDFREAMTLIPHQISRQSDQIDNHDKRLVKLETQLLVVA